MLKKEIIWRELLYQTIEKKKNKFQQKEIAKKFGFSLSTVNGALKVPRKTGAVRVTGRFFVLINPEKMLYLWATFRNLEKDIVYKTYFEGAPKEIESLMPSEAIFGAYSAYTKKFKIAPADYDKIYVYLRKEHLEKFKKRFPFKKGEPNVFVLEADKFLSKHGGIAPIALTFVDIWNLKDWYDQDFYKDFQRKLISVL